MRLREGRVILPKENPLRDENEPLGRFFLQLIDGLGPHAPTSNTTRHSG